jgi:hypothetical protein
MFTYIGSSVVQKVILFLKLPPYNLAGVDLTTHKSAAETKQLDQNLQRNK